MNELAGVAPDSARSTTQTRRVASPKARGGAHDDAGSAMLTNVETVEGLAAHPPCERTPCRNLRRLGASAIPDQSKYNDTYDDYGDWRDEYADAVGISRFGEL